MKRREFITLFGGAAVAWPLLAHAQQPAMPVIGFLHPASPEQYAHLVVAFRDGLGETGYVAGQNVAIEYRWAQNKLDLLPELAADLVRRRVAVIATPGSTPAALAAKAATTTIPIIFAIGTDPVGVGLVASLNRPSGNVTGVAYMQGDLGAKRLGLLHELLPGAARFAVLVNPDSPAATEPFVKNMQAAASAIGRQIEFLTASTNRGIDMAFASLIQKRADALLVNADPLFLTRRVQLVTHGPAGIEAAILATAKDRRGGLIVFPDSLTVIHRALIIGLAAQHSLPAIYPFRIFSSEGGLLSYGLDFPELYRQAATYVDRVLRGEKPADLPVQAPNKFELVINLKTAKTLGLTVPLTLQASADEVIE